MTEAKILEKRPAGESEKSFNFLVWRRVVLLGIILLGVGNLRVVKIA